MTEMLQIFTMGLGGVFVGMAALFLTIHLTHYVIEKFSKGTSHDV
jgi:hypothetical protein